MADKLPIIQGEEAEAIKKRILDYLAWGKRFWEPLHRRQDYWLSMYLLLDALQNLKPLGVRRFISNEPRSAIDAAVSILTRNPITWRIDLIGSEDENKEEVAKIGKIERTLLGIGYDLDELMAQRLLPPFWVQVAQQALLRGQIWAKVHITTDALFFRSSPIIAEVYDSRLVYPHIDSFGLNYVIIEKATTLGDIRAVYPNIPDRYVERDPNTPVLKVEFWSNNRPNRPGIMACLAVVGSNAETRYDMLSNPRSPQAERESLWLIPPMIHGYPPEALPVVGVAANGLAVRAKPQTLGLIDQRLAERADVLALSLASWQAPHTWVAEVGRSLLSVIEEHVPQYNELVATIFQHFSLSAYGTWVFRNRTGEVPNWKPGLEAQIALKPDESVERIAVEPISPDAYRLLQVFQLEREKGVLSSVLQAALPQQFSSAILFQQVANAALNTLEPYRQAMQQFSSLMGTSILTQMQLAAPVLQPFEIIAPTRKNTYFRIEFDPSTDLDSNRKYRPVAVMKPALPDDIITRMQAARLALDPRRPILSLMTVLETVLQIDDPAGELDRIWEDIAQTDPVIVLEQIAQALERRGEMEMAQRIREAEFRQRFVEELQMRQLTGGIPQLPQREGGGGPAPEAGMTTEQTAPAQPGAGEPNPVEALGLVGEREAP